MSFSILLQLDLTPEAISATSDEYSFLAAVRAAPL